MVPRNSCLSVVPVTAWPIKIRGRSTMEVYPNFSEAPPLRSSLPHPKTDLSAKNQIASRRIIPYSPSIQKGLFLRPKIGIPTTAGYFTPSFRKQVRGNVLPLS